MRNSWLVLICVLAGCATPPGGFDSPLPAERVRAMTRAARDGDKAAVAKVIPFLNSDDPVVRLAAIRTLEVLTGQTLGYEHAAPEWRRREMVEAWVEWYKRTGGAGEDRVKAGGEEGLREGVGGPVGGAG